jgi:hypothetical protein
MVQIRARAFRAFELCDFSVDSGVEVCLRSRAGGELSAAAPPMVFRWKSVCDRVLLPRALRPRVQVAAGLQWTLLFVASEIMALTSS